MIKGMTMKIIASILHYLERIASVKQIYIDLIVKRSVIENEQVSRFVRKPTFWFPIWSDTNQAIRLQKMARGLKFRI